MLLGVLGVGSIAFFVNRAMDEAGVSGADLKKNPQIGALRIAAAVDPNLEIISEDEDDNSIILHNKRKNQTLRMRVNPDTRQMEIEELSGNGDVTILGGNSDSPDTGVPLPSWVPAYPGASARSRMSAETTEGASNTFTFRTSDSAQQVLGFYEQRLKSGGFTITRVGGPEGGMLMAQDAGPKRSGMVSVAGNGDVVIQVMEKP